MTRRGEAILLTALFMAGVGLAIWSSLGLSPVARLAPLVVAVPTLLLLGIELLRQISQASEPPAADDRTLRNRELALLPWLGVLAVSSYLLGMALGLPLFVLSYLRLRSSETWTTSIAVATGLWIALYGVLLQLLEIPLFRGRLMTGFGPP